MTDNLPARSGNGAWSRRQFLKAVGGLGLTAAGMGLLEACGAKPDASGAAGGDLETTTIRIPLNSPGVGVCTAPLYMADEFLRAEGFTDIQYLKAGPTLTVDTLAAGTTDITLQYSGPSMLYIDAGKPVTMLAGVHIGCFVLFGSQNVNEIHDLKGKTLAVAQLGGPDHVYLSVMLKIVDVDPVKDVTWTTLPLAQTKQLFTDGKIDAMLAFPPTAQELRAKQIGHVVVNSMVDKPWSDYFCCMVTVSQNFMQQYPRATKAALRSILQATDICATQPQRAAQFMVDKGFAADYNYTVQAMQEIPYNRWRQYNPEDTVRYYALKLRDAGMIKSAPEDIIKHGTNWQFLDELKNEIPATPMPAGAFASPHNLLCNVNSNQITGAGRPRSAE